MNEQANKSNGGVKEPKVIALFQIALDDAGQIHITCPPSKQLALSMLLDAMKLVANLPNPEEKKPLIERPRLVIGGKPV